MHNKYLTPIIIICILFIISENYGQIKNNNYTATENIIESSNLPLVVIDTYGKTIENNVKINARMKIIYNDPPQRNYVSDPGNIYDGNVGIEIRGTYSASLPQKPYGFETRDSLGNNLNVSLLNMPAENDWILLANYNDKVFMRNTLAFDLFRRMGHYQMNTRICEVILNDEYRGIYVLTEKIKQDKNRVNISKLISADTSGNDVTGGYIIKIDYDDGTGKDGWVSNYPAIDRPGSRPYFVYDYPKPYEILNKQKQYIQSYITRIDSVLRSTNWTDSSQGYRKYLNVSAFIDYFIVGEVSRNVDAYKKSAYFYKDRDDKDGRLQPGPVWDFDWAWKNINECMVNGIDGSGWTYLISSVCRSSPVPPGWVVKLLDDETFADELRTRYNELRRTILSEDRINHYIDSVSTLVNEAQVRHYEKWPILGRNVGTPEVDDQPKTFEGEITKFKSWISTRIKWLDANMPGKDLLGVNTQDTKILQNNFTLYQNFPNPFNPVTTINYTLNNTCIVSLKVYNPIGREIAVLINNERKTLGTHSVSFNALNLSSGVYFYQLRTQGFVETGKMVLVK